MIAVSIVTYHTPLDELRYCLSQLAQTKRVTRIDIVDNSGSPYIERLCANSGLDHLNYIPSENVGYGAAHNISVRKDLQDVSIKYHLVINSDIRFEPADLERMVALMESDANIGMSIPKILGGSGEEQSSYHPLPLVSDLLIRRLTPRWAFRRRKKEYNILLSNSDGSMDVPYIHGCFMLIRLSAFERVGIFDERYFMYPEDIDLSRRIREHFHVLAYPGVTITHMHRASSRHSMKMLLIHITNMVKYYKKWGWRQKNDKRRFAPRLYKGKSSPII